MERRSQPLVDTASRPDSDGHAARTPTCGSSRTARPRSRSGANSAALQHGREELAQPRRPSAALSVVQRCRQPCFTRSAVTGTSPASVPPCAGCGALAAPEPATTPDPVAEERNPRLAGRCSRRQKCSSFNESGAPACAAGSGGGWPVNPTSASAGSGHAKLARLLVGPGKRARLSARVRGLLVRRGGVCRREEPPRDESGLRAHGSNQRFHRLLGHAVARVRTTAPSLAGLGPAARRILIHHGWRRKGPPGTLSRKGVLSGAFN